MHHLFSVQKKIITKVTGQNLNIIKLNKDRVTPWWEKNELKTA